MNNFNNNMNYNLIGNQMIMNQINMNNNYYKNSNKVYINNSPQNYSSNNIHINSNYNQIMIPKYNQFNNQNNYYNQVIIPINTPNYNQMVSPNYNQMKINSNYNQKNIIIKKEKINIKNEVDTGAGQMMIPIETINKTRKSICKIFYEYKKFPYKGTGFFILLNNNFKCLLTNYHVISKDLIDIIINIEIYNNKKIQIILNNNRYYKFYNNIDLTIIEIKESDNIIKDIQFLYYDLNYKTGYEQYLNYDIFTLQYPKGTECYANSKIIKIIKNNNEFWHNIKTDNGSSGCPIIMFSTLKVIGIHRGGDKNLKINYGSFIGEILNEIEIELLNKKNKDNLNKIKDNSINIPYSKYEKAEYSHQPFYNISGYAYNSYNGKVGKYNEDRIKTIVNYQKPLVVNGKKISPRISYFGVFDGHGGEGCSNFLTEKLDTLLFNSKFFPGYPIQAAREAFINAENIFLQKAIDHNKNVLVDLSGSCACVMLIINDTLYAINLGDCRALLSTDSGQTLRQITRDHKPNDPIEKKRIEKSGAKVYYANKVIVDGYEITLKESNFGVGFQFPYRIRPGGISVSFFL